MSISLTILIFLQVGTGIPTVYQPQNPQPQSSTPSVSLEQYQGTVFPAPNFHIEADCQALSQAMKGFGKIEKKRM